MNQLLVRPLLFGFYCASLVLVGVAWSMQPKDEVHESTRKEEEVELESAHKLMLTATARGAVPMARVVAIYDLRSLDWPGLLPLLLQIVYEEPEFEGLMSLIPLLAQMDNPGAQVALERLIETGRPQSVRQVALLMYEPRVPSRSTLLRVLLQDQSEIVRQTAIQVAHKLMSFEERTELHKAALSLLGNRKSEEIEALVHQQALLSYRLFTPRK